jgi:hypothetical protein
MKAYIKLINHLLYAMLFLLLIAYSFGAIVAAGVLLAAILAGIFIPKPESVLRAVTVEIWTKDIIDNLFKNNDFAVAAFNADQYVIGGKVVHIPQAGSPDSSIKNLDTFPQDAVKRADSDVLYGLDTYYQKPKFVEKVEQYELSYDKRQSIAGEMEMQLIQDSMEGLLYRWAWKAPANIATTPINVVLTTGGNTTVDLIAGATGTRKTFDKSVFGSIKKAMDNANILTDGRIALLTANHYQQFIDSLSDAAQTNFYRFADMQKGVIGMFLGFKIMMRSTVQRWRQVATVWTPVDEQATGFGASDQTGDSAASLFYHPLSVERAVGAVNVFDSAGRPEYYGDVFSMNMRLGGRTRRAAGVYAVVEDVVAP